MGKYLPQQTIPDSFESRVIRRKGGKCWLWTGNIQTNGYARLDRRENGSRKTLLGHRIAYELHIGPIPKGLVIDHLCRNRGCVNPDHLEAVTNEENIARGNWSPIISAKRTHCTEGHEYNEKNTRLSTKGSRICRICERRKARLRYQKKIAQVGASVVSQ